MPFGMQPLRLPLDRMEKDWSESSIQDMKAESQLTTVEKEKALGESGQMLSNQLFENTLLMVQSVKKKRIESLGSVGQSHPVLGLGHETIAIPCIEKSNLTQSH
ncbi:hypothetical protein V6N12_019724 [Hibiscus sabdariffa]|uniref:Uncharacterized protein n=1 Tax=Hibiscus sabdariffa TaxID=183260 RepID=A0ABR2B568_9ROSI